MEKVIALAGNPNVGKSTVFNAFTGMKQHTGNWPGKTVERAEGSSRLGETQIHWVDLPGCYSLLAHSEEEEVARDFICFDRPDAVIVVCDATCLERNLNLALQVMETTKQVVVCVNLLDEARKKKIQVDLKALSAQLGVPVAGAAARSAQGLREIPEALERLADHERERKEAVLYPEPIENALAELTGPVARMVGDKALPRWVAVRLLEENESFIAAMEQRWGYGLLEQTEVAETLLQVRKELEKNGYGKERIRDAIAEAFVKRSEQISRKTVRCERNGPDQKDRMLDRIFTGRLAGFPIMFLFLLLIFWITISGANMPSALLAKGLFWIQDRLAELAIRARVPETIWQPLIFGVYRVLAWVVSVMLPPMAIFFPLFTLLEDFGYLPRVAFNLDRCFQKCRACGKQALTMCMGFGCNAVGVTGCRIIDSPRERLIAILTNSFVPCNGRFPTIVAVISMFLTQKAAGLLPSFLSAFFLALAILLGIIMTFAASAFLSGTVLKGMPSSFTLELPPYRRPQLGKVIVRSVFDRTVFVLGRAVMVAAPAGLFIWLMANVAVGDVTLLARCTGFLDPFARLMGLDGVILMAFILGMPANEIVVPVILMAYLSQGSLMEIGNLHVVKQLLVDQGWNWITAVSMILFTLMHWPCATTCLTIRKETQSLKWMFLSIALPTAMGIAVCILFTAAARFLSGL